MTAHYADVADPESVEACIAEIVAAHGKIDNLVTSAGFTENFEAINYPIDRMRRLWGVNVDGTYLFATAVARHLVCFFFFPRSCFIICFVHWLTRSVRRWSARPRAAWSSSAV